MAILFFGTVSMGLVYGDNIPLWAATSGAIGTLYVITYVLIGHYTLAVIPSAVAAYFSLYALQQAMFDAMPHAILISGSSIFIMAMLAWLWSKKLLTR